jgi:serine/threonine protein kinase
MDQYFVVKLLGRGFEGQVVLCENKKTNEQVAIKRIELDTIEKANETINEAWRLTKLHHKNIVQYKRVFMHKYPTNENPFVCLIMEYCESGKIFLIFLIKKELCKIKF